MDINRTLNRLGFALTDERRPPVVLIIIHPETLREFIRNCKPDHVCQTDGQHWWVFGVQAIEHPNVIRGEFVLLTMQDITVRKPNAQTHVDFTPSA